MNLTERTGRLFIALTFCLLLSSIQAAPYDGKRDTLKQPDGTEVSVYIWGDEYYQHVESLDGQTLVRDPQTREICYAELSDDGEDLISTGRRYSDTEWSTKKVKDSNQDTSKRGWKNPVRLKRAKVRDITKKNKALLEPVSAVAPEPAETAPQEYAEIIEPAIFSPTNRLNGSYKGIVLLIDFSDQVATISQSNIDNFCNQAGYTGYSNNGSIYDYFNDVSGGKLQYTNHVTAYYRAKNPKSYYEDPNVSYGTRARELIREALNYLDDVVGFDFYNTLSRSGSTVKAVNALYAGNASSGWSKGLWPHKGSGLGWSSDDGASCSVYQISDIESSLSIGTFCHENGHMLCGYPDLYDYGGESSGVGNFGLMAAGAHLNYSRNPAPPCSYLRHTNGWETLVDLGSFYGVQTHAITANSNTGYYFMNPDDADEFFMIEARRKTGRSANLPDEGLMIWHVDRGGSNNNEQMTPTSHYKVSLEQADGQFDLENNRDNGDTYDLFHSGYRYTFNDTTTPNSSWWSGLGSGLNIQNVGAVGSTMTFETHNSGIQLSFDTPVDGELFNEGDDLYVLVNAEDANGSITDVKLYIDDTFVRQESGSPYEWGAVGQNDPLLNDLTAGFHVLKAVAADNEGNIQEQTIMIEVLGPVVVDLTKTQYNYDLGAYTSVVMDGWTLLHPDMFGDISWSGSVKTADRGTNASTNNINRDFVYNSTPATLNHKLVNGLWRVTINMGDKDYPHDNMVVTAEGQVMHADVDSTAGQYSYANFDILITDGELNIQMSDSGGSDANWVWNRLSLTWIGAAGRTDAADFAALAAGWQTQNPTVGRILYDSYNTYAPGSLTGQGGWSDFLSAPSVTTSEIYPGGGNAIYAADADTTYRFAKKSIPNSTDVTANTYYLSTTFTVTQAANATDDSILMALASADNSLPKMEFRFRPKDGSIVVTGWGGYNTQTGAFSAQVGKLYRAVVKVSPIAGSSTTARIDAGVYEIVNGELMEEGDYAWQINNYTFALNNSQKTYPNVLCGIRSNEIRGDDLLVSSTWTAIQDAVSGQMEGNWQHIQSDYNRDNVIDMDDLTHLIDHWLQ